MKKEKLLVKEFWNKASCGETLYMTGKGLKDKFENELKIRYEIEPYIIPFANFKGAIDKKVLEIGVGLGADHQKFAEHGAILYGCDLTERAVEHTKNRLTLFGLSSEIQVADAENLPYANDKFDWIYTWGVIHHSPNTEKAAKEIYRVLKPNGIGKIMIYHKKSLVGYMLWLRYALMRLKPFITLDEIYAKYLESPGTKAYTKKEAEKLFQDFKKVKINTVLTHGDLLTSKAGQRHQGILLTTARKIFPRTFIRRFFPHHGLFMLIEATK